MKSRQRILFAAVVGVAFAAGLHADTVNNVSNGGQSIFSTETWNIAAFSDQDDYVLASGYLSNSGTTDGTFGGRTFTVASGVHFQPNVDPSSTLRFPNEGGIVFRKNSSLRHWNTSATQASVTITGSKLTVEDGDNSNPLWLRVTKTAAYSCTYNFDLPLVGSSAAYIRLYYYNSTYKGRSILCLNGDSSAFKGVIVVSGNNNELVFGNDTFGGDKVYLEAPCKMTLPSAGELKVPSLQLANVPGEIRLIYRYGGSLGDATYGMLDLAGTGVTFEGNTRPVVLQVPTDLALFCSTGDVDRAVTLIRSNSSLDAAKFSLDLQGESAYGATPKNPRLRVAQDGDGAYLLQLVFDGPRYSLLLSSDSSAEGNHHSSFLSVNATNWSDGTTLDPAVHYIVPKGLQLMSDSSVPVLTGAGLTLVGAESRLAICQSNLELTNLVCQSGSVLFGYVNGLKVSGTPIRLQGNTRLRPAVNGSNTSMVFDVPFTGDGAMEFDYQGGACVKTALVRLNCPSPDHTGPAQMSLSQSRSGAGLTAENAYFVVEFSDPLAFGGASPTYISNGLRVGYGHRIRPLQSMTFQDGLNRGFILGDPDGIIETPTNVTLTFMQPMLWMGTLKKYGAGTFAHGGKYAPRFMMSWNENPAAYIGTGTNRVAVYEGAVRALSTNAFDGVEFRFFGGSLQIGVDPDETGGAVEALRKYGLVDVKIPSPFVSDNADGRIALTFDPGQRDWENFGRVRAAVCTVRDEATARALLAVFRPLTPKGIGARLSAAANDLGTWTVSADVGHEGFMVIVR